MPGPRRPGDGPVGALRPGGGPGAQHPGDGPVGALRPGDGPGAQQPGDGPGTQRPGKGPQAAQRPGGGSRGGQQAGGGTRGAWQQGGGTAGARERELVRRGYDLISCDYRGDDGQGAAGAPDASRYAGWVDEICALLPTRAPVLDLGCGAGVPVTRELTGRGLQVLGVDFSAVQLHRARRLVPAASLVQADMTSLAIRSGTFAAVVSFYALFHLPLPQQRALFGRIRRWLRPGGYLMATVGAQWWTGTADYLGADMFWANADSASYLGWLSAARLAPVWHRFVPEGRAGHTLVLAKAA